MAVKWIGTTYPNVRYYEHSERRTRNGQPDKYFSIRYYVNGKRKEEGIGWASQGWNAEKCYKILSKLREAIRTGKGPQTLAQTREQAEAERKAKQEQEAKERLADITLEEFFRVYYLPRAKKEKRSWCTDEQRIVKNIVPSLGHYPLKAVQRDMVQKFLDGLSESGLAPATVKQYMGIIRHAFNMAAEILIDGTIPLFVGKNPVKGTKLPPIHNARERYLQRDEAARLIEASENLRSPDLHDAIILSLNTGLRLGELTRLRWLDIDFAAEIITVPDADKRKPGGKVPLNQPALAILTARKARLEKGDERVFPPCAGGEMRSNLSAMFKKLVDDLGFNEGISDQRYRIVFHTLRHTFASWLALAGTDIYRIKTLMRHKTISMTMRYAHLIPDAARDAVNKIAHADHSRDDSF